MSIDRVKYVVVPVLYVFAVMAFVSSMFFIQKKLTDIVLQDDDSLFELVSKENITDQSSDKPVVLEEKVIVRPYNDQSVVVVRNFYDNNDEASKQENSLIYYENTYIQNSGIDYSGNNSNFDIVAIYDGTVIAVKEDDLLGMVIQIRHSNDMISVYQSLSDINVQVDDVVLAGDIIGKSGISNISSNLKDHLHFELIYKGKVVNPEEYYDKKINQL